MIKATLIAFFLVLAIVARSPAQECVGDCDGDGDVTVDQVLTLVNIALDNAALSACAPGDADASGAITIDEVILALANALNGCPGPRIAGDWLENQFRLVSSTCPAAVTNAFRDALAGLPACVIRIRVTGPEQVRGTSCDDNVADGTFTSNGVISFTSPPTSEMQSGCTVTDTQDVTIDASHTPTTANYRDRIQFAGTCAMPACTVTTESHWTLQP